MDSQKASLNLDLRCKQSFCSHCLSQRLCIVSFSSCFYFYHQAVQQMTISLCTGHFPPEVLFSTGISLLSLSWGASRAFFVERSPDQADPDPKLKLVLMRVFPLMLIEVVNR